MGKIKKMMTKLFASGDENKGRPKKEKAEKVLMTFQVEKELRERFMKIAEKEDKTASQILREFMRVYVAEHKQPELFV